MADTDFNYDVFLSHNGKDKPAVEDIARLLRDKYNVEVWLDKWNLVPGEPWQDALEDALDDCQTVAVFLGPSGIGPWENEEMRSAIEDRVRDPNRRVIPVLLPEAPDNRDLKLPRFLRGATWVDFHSGLDDEEALYRLYCGITGQEPGDRGPLGPTTKAVWHIPHPYPMPPNFTGREVELDMLDTWLTDNKNRLFILCATGGFGKSALAWQWISTHVNLDEWPKVIWWSFYEGDASFENFIRETLEYLNVEVPPGQRQQVDVLLKAMGTQKILLIMDGFERALRAYSSMTAAYQSDEEHEEEEISQRDCVNINAEIFLKNLCILPNIKGKVLMTIRLTPRAVEQRGELLDGCHEEELQAMQKEDAVAFFRAQGIRGTRAEIEAACEPYGYHPLSLRILAGLIANDRKIPGDIAVAGKLDITEDVIQNKHHVLKVAYNTLAEEQQKLLSHIACFRSAMTYDALNAISDENIDADLKTLEHRGLLHWDKTANKYDLHPIVRRYAYENLTASDRTGAHERLVNYFEAVPTPQKVEKLEDLAPVIELYHHMVRAGNLDEACDLIYDRLTKAIYYQFGAYQLFTELLRALFPDGEEAPPRLKKESDQAWTFNELGMAYGKSGQPFYSVKLREIASGMAEKTGNKKNLAIGLGNMAQQQLVIGALSAAERNLRRQIDLCREIADEHHEAIGHRELGRVLFYCGKWDEAEQELSEALRLFTDESNLFGQATIWQYKSLGKLIQRKINASNSSASKIIQSIDLLDKWSKANFPVEREYVIDYWLLGAENRINENLGEAEKNLSKALNLCRQINLVEVEADILLDLARLRYASQKSTGTTQGDFKDAQEKASEALVITERSGYVL